VRRHAIAFASLEGFTEQATGEVAIIATEIAHNVLKHAVTGEVHVTGLSGIGASGVEILAIDKGPGMANWHDCMADGFSTAGTAGNGLGAISRLADTFDAYSRPGQGTVLVARKFAATRPANRTEEWTLGAVRAPYPGETYCGDNWSARRNGTTLSLIVADGLGHGFLASEASTAAVAVFQTGREQAAGALLEGVHLALRSTRGAAVAVVRMDSESRQVRYAGLGNIAGILLGGARPQFMVSHNGTAGLEARRCQEFEYQLPPDATLVMHSDGLTTSWSVEAYPGLLRRHPSVIAGILYRDASRGRDDVCVVVGRYMRE
jgi:anti-sigma regulatory factor (Ser/Thr protein kinase)